MNNHQIVSVLIPLYNAELFFANTIESVLRQTYPYLEIIVVDDGSQDGSAKLVKQYQAKDSRITLLKQPNQGPSAARNRAFAASHGQWIQYLDADDMLSPEKIERQLKVGISHPDCIVYGDIFDLLPHEKKKIGFVNKNFKKGIDFIIATSMSCGPTGIHLIPRKLVTLAGEWASGYNVYEDVDFFSRAILHSDGLIYCPDTALYYRKDHSTHHLSNRNNYLTSKSWEITKKIINRISAKDASNMALRQVVLRWISNWYWQVYPHLPIQRHESIQFLKERKISFWQLNIHQKRDLMIKILGVEKTAKLYAIYKHFI